MFGSATIEVILGMVFLFLLLSIVCSTINEWIASILQLRGKTLRMGIYQLLRDHSYPENVDWLADSFYNHPLVRGLSNTKEETNKTFPSYIPAETFARVLIDLVMRGDEALEELRTRPLREYYGEIRGTVNRLAEGGNRLAKVLLTLIDQAGLDEAELLDIQLGWEDVKRLRERLEAERMEFSEIDQILRTIERMETKLRLAEERVDETINNAYRNVEDYFNNMMDRVSGWYKRGVQFRTVFLAAGVTLLLNVNSITLYQEFSNNPTVRAAVVAAAEQANTELEETVEALEDDTVGNAIDIRAAVDSVEALNLSIGWNEETIPARDDLGGWFNHVMGWILTIVAVSMGTPFWFDILNRLTSLRLTGKKPDSGIIQN